MARTFVAASSEYLRVATGIVTAPPLTIAGWAMPAATGIFQTILSICDSANSNEDGFGLYVDGSSNLVNAITVNNGVGSQASTSGGVSAGAWCHAAGVIASSTSRAAYLNGGSKGTNSTSRTPAGTPNATSVGRFERNGAIWYWGGRLAEVGVWSVALDDDEVAALAKGYSPLQIRPQSLVAYWPLFGNDATEIDRWKNGHNLAVTGAVKAEHPRIYYPAAIAA